MACVGEYRVCHGVESVEECGGLEGLPGAWVCWLDTRDYGLLDSETELRNATMALTYHADDTRCKNGDDRRDTQPRQSIECPWEGKDQSSSGEDTGV